MFSAAPHKRFLFIFLAFLIFLSFAVTVFAASSTYLSEATKYFNKVCKAKVKGDRAALCYLFEKSKETDQAMQSVQTTNQSQAQEITDLKETISSLEAQLQEKPVKEVTIFPFQFWADGAYSDTFEASGYRQIVMDAESQVNSATIVLYYSDNQTDWTEQGGVRVASGTQIEHVQKVFPVKGKYYKGRVMFSSNFQGFATAVLY